MSKNQWQTEDLKLKKRQVLQKKYLQEKSEIPRVSVIVPVYNVECYLEECLESIVRQTLEEIEVICINDGSTDRSLEILRAYEKADSRIHVIDKENEGYGVGMNIGMDHARGEYVGIVEPDDYVPLDMFEDLYLEAKEQDLDFVKADFYRFVTAKDGSVQLSYNHLTHEKNRYRQVFCPSMEPETLKFLMNTWSGIYRNEFLKKNHIRHHETPGASFQDNGFWMQTFCYAQRAMILDTPYYRNRRDNPNSSVNSPEKVYCMNEEYRYIKEILSKDEELWNRFKPYYTWKKFCNYMFTLSRIHVKWKHQYIMDICKEFKEADALGELDRSVFDERRLKKLELLMANPEAFYYTECVRGSTNLEQRVYELENSTTYKMGKAVMYVPQKVKKILKNIKKR